MHTTTATKIGIALACFAVTAVAKGADSIRVAADVMVDIAASYSFAKPPNHERAYTTQPSRNGEIGLMLGHAGVVVQTNHLTTRFVLQAGWFTEANYVGADSAWRHLQEASIVWHATKELDVEVGIMQSHIGYESMIPRKNLVLSRNLISDYTPYYETGAAVRWKTQQNVVVGLHVLNGWQRIVENNESLSFGTSLLVSAAENLRVSWNTFIGNDQPTGTPELLRFHNDVWAEWKPTSASTLVAIADVGLQERATAGTDKSWYGAVLGSLLLNSKLSVCARAEHFNDADRLYVSTPTNTNFVCTGASIGANLLLAPYLLFRAELRTLSATQPVFPSASGYTRTDTFITVSMSAGL